MAIENLQDLCYASSEYNKTLPEWVWDENETPRFAINGDDLTLKWMDDNTEAPSEELLQYYLDLRDVQETRASQYPPVADYLDGVVKGDQDQIDAYIAACQAVKDANPLPTKP
jgi:hypothetical protein